MAERAIAQPEVRQIYVADRETDILALLIKARDLQYAADSCSAASTTPLPSGDKLWAKLAQTPVLGSVRFEFC